MPIEFENGFGMASGEEVADLNKALSAGYATSPDTQTNGGAFRVESLENSLKVLTYTDQHIKLWKRIPKLKAFNTVEEYNQLLSYGSDGGGFLSEGEVPDVQDSTYQRKASFVKFMGVTREVTHPMTLVNSAHGDVMSRMNQDGILWIMKKLESGLFWGNSKLGAGGSEFVEFDGLDTMIDAENTLDLAGNALQEKHINFGAQMIISNYGVPTDLFLPYEVYGQFAQEYYDRQRMQMPVSGTQAAGTVVDKFNTHGGPVNMEPNIFLKKTKEVSNTASSPKAPAAPSSVVAEINLSENGAEFGKSGAGTYTYYVTAANRHGESTPVKVAADVAISGADLTKSINVKVKNAASTAFAPDYLTIYRSEANGTKAYQIARVPVTSSAADAETVFVDKNETMPNTYTAFMGELNEQVLAYKQLAPMMKMDLAPVAPAYRWMILQYGVPILYAPRKFMKFKNIKAEMSI